MRSLRLLGLSGILAVLSFPSIAAAQIRAQDLRTDMRIRVQWTTGQAGTGLFLGILGDTLFYEEATILPANVATPSGLTHSVVKVPLALIKRLDVRIQPEPSFARDKCEGVLRGAGCGAKIAVDVINDDMQHGRANRDSNGYEGIVDGIAAGGAIIGGAVVGLIKSANRRASKNPDFGWRSVRLPEGGLK